MAEEIGFHPVREADLPRLLEMRNDPEVRRWMYTDHVITSEEHWAWFASRVEPQLKERHPRPAYWVVDLWGEPAGLIAFHNVAIGGSATWAQYLVSTGDRGKGIGKVLAFNVMQLAFEHPFMSFPKLFYEVLETNERVIGLMESIGWTQIKSTPQRVVVKDGKNVKALTYYMHQHQWEHDGIKEALEERIRKDGREPRYTERDRRPHSPLSLAAWTEFNKSSH